MSVVVDASVLVAAMSDAGEEGTWAEDVLARSRAVFAPHLALVEATNILRGLEASKLITSAAGAAALADLLDLDLVLAPFDPFAERVWELRRNLTSYDAWYVAVAEALGLPLATLDRRLARAPGPSCRFLTPRSRAG